MRWARRPLVAAVVRYPVLVIVACLAIIAGAITTCALLPLEVNTGINGFYARKGATAQRWHSLWMMERVLPAAPNHAASLWDLGQQLAELHPSLQYLGDDQARTEQTIQVAIQSLGSRQLAGSAAKVSFGQEDGTLHVLLKTRHGDDIFSEDNAKELCRVHERILSALMETRNCMLDLTGAVMTVRNSGHLLESLTNHDKRCWTVTPQNNALEMKWCVRPGDPGAEALEDDPGWGAAWMTANLTAFQRQQFRYNGTHLKLEALPELCVTAGNEAEMLTVQPCGVDPPRQEWEQDIGDGGSFFKVKSSGLCMSLLRFGDNGVPSFHPGTWACAEADVQLWDASWVRYDDDDLHHGVLADHCAPTWSVMNMRGLLEDVGLGGVLRLIDDFGLLLPVGHRLCAHDAEAAGKMLCETSVGCDPDTCESHGTCLVHGMEVCPLLAQLPVTVADVELLQQLPLEPLNSRGCEQLDMQGLQHTVQAGALLYNWSHTVPELTLVGMPIGAMVDSKFGKGGSTSSTMTRLVFKMRTNDGGMTRKTWMDNHLRLFSRLNQDPQLQLSWRQSEWFQHHQSTAVFLDLRYAAGSLAFVFCWIWLQGGSFFLALGGMLGIFGSFPLALFLYTVVLGIRWIGLLNFLGVFIVLGIGADDIFVILEHWSFSKTAAGVLPTLEARMDWTLRNALIAISSTSFTTMAAFIANMVSDIAPIRLFGIFMALIVGTNFLLVITLFPALVCLYEKWGPWISAKAAAAKQIVLGGRRRQPRCADISAADDSYVHPEKLRKPSRRRDGHTSRPVLRADSSASSAGEDDSLLPRRPRLLLRVWDSLRSLKVRSSKVSGTERKRRLRCASSASSGTEELEMTQLVISSSWECATSSPRAPGSCDEMAIAATSRAGDSQAPLAGIIRSLSCEELAIAARRPMGQEDSEGDGKEGMAIADIGSECTAGADAPRENDGGCGPLPPSVDEAEVEKTAAGTAVESPFKAEQQSSSQFRLTNAVDEADETLSIRDSASDFPSVASDAALQPQRLWRGSVPLSSVSDSCLSGDTAAPQLDDGEAAGEGGAEQCGVGSGRGLMASAREFIESFFHHRLPAFVLRWKWAILSVAVILAVASAALATKLRSPSGVPRIWRRGSNMDRYYQWEMEFEWGKAEELVKLSFVWGALPSDHGSLNLPYEMGEVVLDPSFNGTSMEAQEWILGFCNSLRSDAVRSRVVQGSLYCPPEVLERLLRELSGGRAGLPVPPEVYLQLLQYLSIQVQSQMHGYTDVMRFMPADAPLGRPIFDSHHPNRELLSWHVGEDVGDLHMKMYDGKREPAEELASMAVRVTLNALSQWPYEMLTQDHRFWQDWLSQQLATAPPGMKRGFQTAKAWEWMSTEQEMKISAMWAVGLSLLLAWLVLLVSTGNLLTAVCATACIGFVVLHFLAAMLLLGWRVGIIESICITVLVGLAVDYVVHIASAYIHADVPDRLSRIRSALSKMGMSSISGAATTIGAALFLLMCELDPFVKFGTFVAVTLATALMYAMLVFPALCCAFGPDGQRGCLLHMARSLVRLRPQGGLLQQAQQPQQGRQRSEGPCCSSAAAL